MKKLFTLMFCSAVLFSCSTENDSMDLASDQEVNFEEQLAKGAYDNSNLGIYKGLFTTLDGQNRATIYITLNGKSEPSVEFSFPDASKSVVRSSANVSKGQSVDAISFDESGFKFDFTVEKDGSNPAISNITYMGDKGDAIILKETSKAAVTTKTGTYTCETGCALSDDDAVPHPELGAPGAIQTFNFMLQGGNEGPITMQYVLNSRVYEGTALQGSCDPGIFGNLITCEIFAQPDLNGNSGPIRFRSLDNPNTSLLFHEYAADATGVTCSSYYGTGIYRSTLFGRSTISIITDDAVGEGGDCNKRK